MDQRVRIGNRKVIETKQGSLRTRMGQGEVRVGVLVRGCTECNKEQIPKIVISPIQQLHLRHLFLGSISRPNPTHFSQQAELLKTLQQQFAIPSSAAALGVLRVHGSALQSSFLRIWCRRGFFGLAQCLALDLIKAS